MVKTILITGSSGLVGNAFKAIHTDFKQYKFIFSTSKDCNLEILDDVRKYFNHCKPDYVIHLSANVGGLYKNMNFKVDMLEKNLLMNFNVIKACYENNVEKLICMLSTCIFPDKVSKYPMNEETLHQGPPHFSNDAYAYAKRMAEIQCKAYNDNFNTNYCCVIPTNIYGPHDNFSLENGHVIPSLVHRCYIAKKLNIPFEVRGSGTPLRQFVYSEDLARYILFCFEKLNKENIIISPEKEYSIKEVSFEIAKAFDYKDNIIFNTKYADGQYRKTITNQKLKNIIEKEELTFIDIKEGLKKTVDFFNNNYDKCRK